MEKVRINFLLVCKETGHNILGYLKDEVQL